MNAYLVASYYLVFLFSTVCHEAAHALAAHLGGDDTALRGGQVSLDPWPHMRREPFGLVLIPLVTAISGHGIWGWASAPFDPLWASRHPRRAAWMALAGPAANLTLFLLAAILMRLGLGAGVFRLASQPGWGHIVYGVSNDWGFAATALSLVFALNIILAVFNLIPFPPLDGSQAITLLMPEQVGERFRALMAVGGNTRVFFVIALFQVMGPVACWLQHAAVTLFFQ